MQTLLTLPGLEQQTVLAPFTTYHIGGPADYFITVHTQAELIAAVQAAREAGIPIFLLGTGANILVSDAGFRGLVIHNQVNQATITGTTLTAGSGAVVADLITLTAAHGLSGLEHFAGIPSTVGGAVWQNLHFLAPDRKETVFIADLLTGAVVLDEEGNVATVDRAFFAFGYDHSILHERRRLVLLEATFTLTPRPAAEIAHQIQENLAWRAAKHPQEYPSCGSVFRRLEGVGAGRLIDQVGLKGHRIGGAQISEKHANFIVNVGGATAADVRALITLVQEKVAAETGYHLEPEISFIGE